MESRSAFFVVGAIHMVSLYNPRAQKLWHAHLMKDSWYCVCGEELGINPQVGQRCKCGGRIEEVLRRTAREVR